MKEIKRIVITGSTRGIGLGLAREFLKRGCRVSINGRSEKSVQHALDGLHAEFAPDLTLGVPGDVCDPDTHQALWEKTTTVFGGVDIWINNAGVGQPLFMVWDLPIETVQQVIDVNMKGLVYGSQTAVRGMLKQGSGHLYNMQGFGSNGRMQAGLSLYGSTKAGVRFLTDSLAKETKGTPVKVSALNPGMVVTDFITDHFPEDPQEMEHTKKIFNILADKVETVTPWLVEKILNNDKSGAKITWLTTGKIILRFATARFSQRDLFS